MRALRQNDDLLLWRRSLREAEGEEAADRMEQLARDAYKSTESNLYALSPETSHVTKEFADGDPQFWAPRQRVSSQPSARKNTSTPKNQ